MLHGKAGVEEKWVCEIGCESLLERREERSSGPPQGPPDIFRMRTLIYVGSRRKGTHGERIRILERQKFQD